MALYSEEIRVVCEGEPLRPVSFTWRDEQFRIATILRSWHDHGFPAGAPRRKNWRMRRHRNYYEVLTEGGRRFEIYLDRKGPALTWILYRELGDATD
jgi:hypothetical protein